MLSREHVIHRSAGEEGRERASRAAGRSGGNPFPVARIWAKFVVLALLTALVGAFLLLNRGAVVEPRLHLVFASYERPSLLVVMLLTALVSAAGALAVRRTVHAMGQLREVPARPAGAPVGAWHRRTA